MLDPDGVNADLNATANYALKLPAANGKLAVIGFCWGGGKAFEFATVRHDLSAAFVFYGPPPQDLGGHHRSGVRLLRGQRRTHFVHGSGNASRDGKVGQEVRSGDLRGGRSRLHAHGRGSREYQSG